MTIAFLRHILVLFSARTLHIITWIILLYTFYKNIQSTNTHESPSMSIRTPFSFSLKHLFPSHKNGSVKDIIKTNKILLVTVQASKVILTRGSKIYQLKKQVPATCAETDTGQAIASHFQKAHISIPFISNSWQSIGESVRFYLLWGIKCIRKKISYVQVTCNENIFKPTWLNVKIFRNQNIYSHDF